MQGKAGASGRPRNQKKVPFYAGVPEKISPPLPISLSSSLSEPQSPSSSGLSHSSASSSSSSSSSSLQPVFCPARRSTALEQKRRSKSTKEISSTKEWHAHHLVKPLSEPAMLSMEESMATEGPAEKGCMESQAMCRRCMTDIDFKSVHGVTSPAAPDLLQLFNIFQCNTPQKPPARMLVNVTLVGNIQAVRLLVAYDATVQDVINASLKGYAKEGRLPRHCIKSQTYGLHLSPFCLECIDPTEMICNLGTRSFYLFPSVDQNPTQLSQGGKSWWNILGLLLT